MERVELAKSFIDREFSSTLSKVKTGLAIVGAKLRIPGAKKLAKRRLVNHGADIALTTSARLIANKLGKDRYESIDKAKAASKIAQDFGVPKLGKILIK